MPPFDGSVKAQLQYIVPADLNTPVQDLRGALVTPDTVTQSFDLLCSVGRFNSECNERFEILWLRG